MASKCGPSQEQRPVISATASTQAMQARSIQRSQIRVAFASLGGHLLDCDGSFRQWAWPGASVKDIVRSKATVFILTNEDDMTHVYHSISDLLLMEPGRHVRDGSAPILF